MTRGCSSSRSRPRGQRDDAALLRGYHVYVVVTGVPEALILRGIHITFAFVLILLLYPKINRSTARPNFPLDR